MTLVAGGGQPCVSWNRRRPERKNRDGPEVQVGVEVGLVLGVVGRPETPKSTQPNSSETEEKSRGRSGYYIIRYGVLLSQELQIFQLL